jgi:hypothetical protein
MISLKMDHLKHMFFWVIKDFGIIVTAGLSKAFEALGGLLKFWQVLTLTRQQVSLLNLLMEHSKSGFYQPRHKI